MRRLNKKAARTFLWLINGLGAGEAKKVDNAEGTFMAVHVDVLRVSEDGQKMVAIGHRYEQNGDRLSDPDVEFWVREVEGEAWIVPTAIDQPLGYSRVVEMNGFTPTGVRPRMQADLAKFCNFWMKNIHDQQGLGKVER